MKVILNNSSFNPNTKVCVLVGCYDEDGRYDAVCTDQATLRDFESSISRNVRLNHDINIHINPGVEIAVFSKSMCDMERYLEIKGGPNYLKELLDCFSKAEREIAYIWTTYDFPSAA